MNIERIGKDDETLCLTYCSIAHWCVAYPIGKKFHQTVFGILSNSFSECLHVSHRITTAKQIRRDDWWALCLEQQLIRVIFHRGRNRKKAKHLCSIAFTWWWIKRKIWNCQQTNKIQNIFRWAEIEQAKTHFEQLDGRDVRGKNSNNDSLHNVDIDGDVPKHTTHTPALSSKTRQNKNN